MKTYALYHSRIKQGFNEIWTQEAHKIAVSNQSDIFLGNFNQRASCGNSIPICSQGKNIAYSAQNIKPFWNNIPCIPKDKCNQICCPLNEKLWKSC